MAKHSWSKYDWGLTVALAGGTFGAAGWIFGAAYELDAARSGVSTAAMRWVWIFGAASELNPAPAESVGILDVLVVFSCAVGVVLTGVFLWCVYLSGRRLSVFVVGQTLLGASFLFGTVAIWWMHTRGVLALAVDANGNYPQEIAYAAPLIILGMMAAMWCPPFRRWFDHTPVQRGTPEGERWWPPTGGG